MTRFAQTPRKHFDDGRSEPALDHSRSSYPLQPGMIPWEITAMERAWVLLKSGRRINLLQPTASDWDDEDLALGLARTYRWGGHSTWELPLSVAQHSLTVLALRQAASAKPLARAEALRELLHDAEEGFLSWDPIAPIKPYLGTQLRSLMRTMEEAIAQRYGLPEWTTEEVCRTQTHKHADRLAAASEAFHVVGWTRSEIRGYLEIELDPVETDPVASPGNMRPWEPWPSTLAASVFLETMNALKE